MGTKPKIRRWHNRAKTITPGAQDGLTQQHMKDECDINKIMAKYQKTGTIAHLAKYQGTYDDFTVMPDFHTAMGIMQDAEEMFLTIPAEIRKEFDNDAGQFVEFATQPGNLERMRELGLALPKSGEIPIPKPGSELPETQPKAPSEAPQD